MRLYLTIFIIGFLLSACSPQDKPGDKTIYGVLDVKVKTLDPIYSSDKYSTRIVSQIFEGLYHYHYLKRPIEIESAIAETLPKISADGLTYTIPLKKGIYFQDDKVFPNGKGREITAEDFIYSWKRLADPSNKSPGFWIFDDRIKGLNLWRENISKGTADYQTPIEGLVAKTPYTLVIHLTKPFFQFTHLLTMSYAMVVPKEAVMAYGKSFVENPIGSGPYRLKKWNRGSQIHLSQNLTYRQAFYPKAGESKDEQLGHLADAGKRLPLTSEIVIKVVSERQPMWLQFMKGNLDHVVLPKDNFDQVIKDGNLTLEMNKKNVSVHFYKRSDLTFVAFNMEHPLLGKNKKLRQAIAMAYDTKSVLKQIYNNRGVIAQGPIPPNLAGYDPNFKNAMTFNLTGAKIRLGEAGFPGGEGLPVFTYDMANQNATSRQIAEFFKLQMAQIGIKIKLVSNSFPQFDKKVKSKKAEIFGMGWYADYPDAENFLQLFYSKNISPGPNMTNFQNRQYDMMYEKAASLKPGPEREALYKQMNSFIAQEAPMLFNVHTKHYLPFHSWLKNYKENSIINDFYKYLRVDSKQRQDQKKLL